MKRQLPASPRKRTHKTAKRSYRGGRRSANSGRFVTASFE